MLIVAACRAAPTGPVQAADAWKTAILSIADPDQSPYYGGLLLEELPDLTPIGPDPVTGLWEFSHARPGSTPLRTETGSLVIGEESGRVFVLVPGGDFFLGAQRDGPSAPGYDANATEWEVPSGA